MAVTSGPRIIRRCLRARNLPGPEVFLGVWRPLAHCRSGRPRKVAQGKWGEHALGLISLAIVLVGGCATVTNSLSSQDMAKIRIDRVEIALKPDANISWPRVWREFAERQAAARPIGASQAGQFSGHF